MSELGLMGKTHHLMVESNMLSLLCEEKLSPGELETKILEKLPNPVRMLYINMHMAKCHL